MSQKTFITRPYREGDEEQIIVLLEMVFGDWPRFDLECTKKEHWTWKMKDTPTGINPTVVTETEEGDIIGVSQGIFKWAKIGDGVYLIRKGAELAVHPDYRRMGISSEARKVRKEITRRSNAVMTYNLTSNEILINRNKRKRAEERSPEFPYPIKQLVKIENIDEFMNYYEKGNKVSLFRSWSIRIGFRLLRFMNMVFGLLSSSFSKKEEVELRRIDRFDDVDEFWDEIKNDYNWISVKSKDVLNWRYCDIRGGSYDIWVAEQDQVLLGYVVTRINRVEESHPVGYLMEVLAQRGREDVVELLVNEALSYFDENNVNAVYFTVVGGHPYEKIMYKHGFLDSRIRPYIYYRVYRRLDDVDKFKNSSPDRLHYQFSEFDSI
ncbi:hypothetical protein GF319_09290 [Candidatus Bathyarchaeota archaeon]|nr:hypothetical protein [Candidatus Bathyarchaeota archaeon]